MNQTSLLCLVTPAPRLPERALPARAAGLVSTGLHLLLAAAVAVLTAWSGTASSENAATHQPLQLPRLVFLQAPGPGGGGGGGGRQQPAPASRAQAKGADRLTMRVARPVAAAERPKDVPPPPPEILLDAKSLAAGAMLIAGLPDAAPTLAISQGSGYGGGAGDGRGTGIGPGTGSGLGAGAGGGFGGGAYRPGNGVSAPTVLKQVRPKYTEDALLRQVQGAVMLEVVVGRDGVPAAVRVMRSLDPGLDHEAIAAVREWRFTPGRMHGVPVDVLVTILLDFRIV